MTCRIRSHHERYLAVDLMEVAAALAATNLRWEVRGADMVLRGDLEVGHMELIPRGARRFELRIVEQDLAELPDLMACLARAQSGLRSQPMTSSASADDQHSGSSESADDQHVNAGRCASSWGAG